MSNATSDTALPGFGRIQPLQSTNRISSADHQNETTASNAELNAISGSRSQFHSRWTETITPRIPTFRYPDLSLPQLQPDRETPGTLHLCPSCPSGTPWRSDPDEEDLESISPDNGTPPSTQVPPVPVNSPRHEPQKVDASYHGSPGSSSQFPHYWKPTVEDEEEDSTKGYDYDMRKGAETATSIPRSQSSSWFEGRLERNKNASSSSIHANVYNIEEVKRCPAARPIQDLVDASNDSELQYWRRKCQKMREEIQQVDTWQAQSGKPPAVIAVKDPNSRLLEAECMVDMMDRRGFKPTSKWLAEYSSSAGLAKRGNPYPLMAFLITEFDEFSQHQESASEDRQTQEELDTATSKGVIDACGAIRSIMLIGSSHPTEAWRKQYDALATNAQDGGSLEPLIELVRRKAQNISLRHASGRAAMAEESLRDNCNSTDLDESGNPNLKVHREYGAWLTKNYQSETEPFGNRFIYIASSINPIVARLDNFEAKQPFVVTLSHYFHEFRLLASVLIMALAVKLTTSEKQRSMDTYAQVWLRDSLSCERFDTPSQIQGFTAQGQAFSLDEKAIIAMIKAKLGDNLDPTAPQDEQFDSASDSDTDGSSSSSASGTTLRRRDSDQSQSPWPYSSRQPHIRLTPEMSREMHPNVVAERGMTLVPFHDFPDMPADPSDFTLYQLSVDGQSSSVFVDCQRCHKTLASFENVEAEPTVVRREENESGDTYIVTSIGSLDNIIDSVDKVKRVWLQIGTHNYFMRANEAGFERTHDCISKQDTPTAAIEQQKREHAAAYYNQKDEEPLEHDRHEDLPPQEPRVRGRQTFCEEDELGHDRLILSAYEPEQPYDQAEYPPPEDHPDQNQSQQDPVSNVRMPPSMQFLPMHSNFPTAELTSVREPCTIISVCEQRGIIHGVYQGVVWYRTIFRGPSDRGRTIYLDIRDGMGGYIGRISRIRHYEVGLMNSQVSTFTAEEEPEERIESIPLPSPPGQGSSIGLRACSTPVKDCADTEADTHCSDDKEVTRHGGANIAYSESDCDVIPGVPKEAWAQTGADTLTSESQHAASTSAAQSSSDSPKEEWISTGTSSSAPKYHQTASVSTSLFRDRPKEEWVKARITTARPASTSVSQSVQSKQRWIPKGVPNQQPKPQQKLCDCSSRKGKEPARKPRNRPGGASVWKSPSEDLRGQGPDAVASPHQVVPSEKTSPLAQGGIERIPSCLRADPQSDRDQIDGEEPVFTESYLEWLRDMYTRPPYSTCGTHPGEPSFQDFWKDRKAGRPATMADGSVIGPETRPESEYYSPDVTRSSISGWSRIPMLAVLERRQVLTPSFSGVVRDTWTNHIEDGMVQTSIRESTSGS